jgi:REP element-mobilizing transposase RayT
MIYSTKNREPFLGNVALRRELEAYLVGVGTLQAIECPPLGLRVVADHLHVLCRLSRTVTIARLVGTMKTESSKWIKRHSRGTPAFQWQQGYAAFSVSA